MKKTVVLSTDDNKNYISYLRYTQLAWNMLGWNTLTFYLGQSKLEDSETNKIINISSINGYRDCTVIQISRLLGYKYIPEGIIMTSDVDMIPLSNYWQPAYDDITCYGYDLTNFQQFPICYIAANTDRWSRIITNESLESLLASSTCTKSNNFNEWWFADQLIVTQKIMQSKIKPNIIHRGLSATNLAIGRVDRSSWNETRYDNTPKIDAHMPRPFSVDACDDIIQNILIPNIKKSF